MSYLPTVAWTTVVDSVTYINPTTYQCTVVPNDPNEVGSGIKQVGYYLRDNVGHTYTITAVNVGGDPDMIEVSDDFGVGMGAQQGRFAFIYKSVGDGEAPYLAPIRYQRLDQSAFDYAHAIELDVMWKNLLHLDQTTPQTVINGQPRFEMGINLPYVDLDVSSAPSYKEGRVFYDTNKKGYISSILMGRIWVC